MARERKTETTEEGARERLTALRGTVGERARGRERGGGEAARRFARQMAERYGSNPDEDGR